MNRGGYSILVVLAAAGFMVGGCTWINPIVQQGGEDAGSGPLVISPSRPRVRLSETTTVRLRSRDDNIPVRLPVAWMSSDPETISVSGSGASATLRAHKLGRVTITAFAADGNTASAEARVR